MSQPDESREKTPKTDAVLMHPDNDPHRTTAEVAPRREHAEIQVERDGDLVPLDQDETG
ncbi:hypothetical protein O7634_19640 [Micromonospora sp. WMMD1120]|uniref:hypothetical protein n=1 Tax=Micromonospora sp. WMMD1120 TaxID=3016106 RepID=UPI00241619D9|nr:hypothetical protein [Micromonospora sp. WMMD1120]MDG4808966.1 hypothetical protein [Micromonospora sp. WMMD1120]